MHNYIRGRQMRQMLTVRSKQHYQLFCMFEKLYNKNLGKQYNMVSMLWLQQQKNSICAWIKTKVYENPLVSYAGGYLIFIITLCEQKIKSIINETLF